MWNASFNIGDSVNGSEKFFLTGFMFMLITAWSPQDELYPLDVQCFVFALTVFFWMGFMMSGDSKDKPAQDAPA